MKASLIYICEYCLRHDSQLLTRLLLQGMVMATQEPAAQPESPLDVLSRAASLVESGASESDSAASPSPPRPQLHPKFRRGHETMAATPPPPYTTCVNPADREDE